MELHHVKTQVEYTLQNYPETRNNDKLLQVIVLKNFYGVESIDDILEPKIPSLESIRRCRQTIQSEGKYESNKKIKEARQEMEETYRQFSATKE